MTRIVVVGDLMTDTVARATLPLAKGSDTPAAVTAHGGAGHCDMTATPARRDSASNAPSEWLSPVRFCNR